MKPNTEGVLWILYFCFVGLGSILFAINVDNPDLNAVKKSASSNVNIPVSSRPVLDKIANEPRPVIAGEETRASLTGKCTKTILKWIDIFDNGKEGWGISFYKIYVKNSDVAILNHEVLN